MFWAADMNLAAKGLKAILEVEERVESIVEQTGLQKTDDLLNDEENREGTIMMKEKKAKRETSFSCYHFWISVVFERNSWNTLGNQSGSILGKDWEEEVRKTMNIR